jgi:signal transduction histidine kinase
MNAKDLKKCIAEKTSLIMQLQVAKRTGRSDVTALASAAARLEGLIAHAHLVAENPDKATANLISQASCLVDAGEILNAVSVLDRARKVAPTRKLKLWIEEEFWKGLTSDTAAKVIGILEKDNRQLRQRVRELEGVYATNFNLEVTSAKAEPQRPQKLESIDRVVIGAVHDFNNLLTVVSGNTDLLLVSADRLSAESKDLLKQISVASERAAELTRQLLVFSRGPVAPTKRLDVNEFVRNMNKMLGRILGEDIKLEVDYWPKLPLIEAEPSMIEQLLLNLAVNSRDAMPKGGRLTIRISVQDVDEQHVRQYPQALTGHFVCLTVADTGCGIAPENLQRIFEPFFTTKEFSKGTGLGLAIVFGIVAQHHGWIEVESKVNAGTSFHIYLPCLPESKKLQTEFTRAPEVRGGNETILLVEDEAAVRSQARTLLECKGYRVIEANSGLSALEIWQKQRETIDLLFTDIVMPEGISGSELAARLLAEKPELKVIYSSRYTDDMPIKNLPLRNNPNFLEKPFISHQLLKQVRDCLDE